MDRNPRKYLVLSVLFVASTYTQYVERTISLSVDKDKAPNGGHEHGEQRRPHGQAHKNFSLFVEIRKAHVAENVTDEIVVQALLSGWNGFRTSSSSCTCVGTPLSVSSQQGKTERMGASGICSRAVAAVPFVIPARGC